MLSGDILPNQTVNIKNLNENVRKEELKRSLYCLFSQYGKIMDVVALKTPNLRGQAWVAFLEVTSASNAVRQMQNFPFYDKPMKKEQMEGPGQVFQIIETFTSAINDSDLGDRISQSLKSWSHVDVGRKIVAGKCDVLSEFL